jgi:hypothetical protein
MKRFVVPVLICAAAAAASPARADGSAPATAAPHLRVAIVPGIAVNLDVARVDALAQDLAEALSTQLDVDATGGLDVRRALPADLPPDCVTIPSCVGDVARRTNAQQLLFVVMVDTGANSSIQIDTTWVDAASGKSAQRPAIDILSATEAKARFAELAHQLLPDAPLRVKPTVGGGVVAPMPQTTTQPRRLTTPAIVLGAVGIVGLGVAAGFGLDTKSTYDSCDAKPGTCSSSTRSSIRTTAGVADASWIVGLGALIAGGVIYARSGGETIVVTPTANGAAVSMSGRF